MTLCVLVLIAASSLIYWLYQINKTHYVLAFFCPRVKTKDGRPEWTIAPVAKGKTIFGNGFDLYGLTDQEVFQHSRIRAKTLKASYIEYGSGGALYNIIDAENAELILNDPNVVTKSVMYDFLHPALHTGLLTSTGKKWHSRRKLLTPTFDFNILGQFEEIFKAESLKFIEQFHQASEISISVSELIPRLTLNIICVLFSETAMAVKLDDMAEKGDLYRQSFAMIEKAFIKRLSNPFYWNTKVYELIGGMEDATALKVVHDFSNEIIAKRRILLEEELVRRKSSQDPDDDIYINKKQRFAMLDTLIFAEKDGLIDHQGICEEVDTLIFAGFDTTSTGLIFALMNMSLYADKQELCYQEINEYIDDDFSNLDVNQIGKLQYLDCFLKESLRMFPAVPLTGRQAVRETELANGLILPAGTQIILHIFDIHRNIKYWDSPDEFQPERFLPENCKDRHTYAFIPFSAGQRNCIGQKFAKLEMKTLLIVVLKKYKILPLVDPKDFVFNTGLTLRTNNNIKVKLVKRQ
ncbi:cytochrome P450 4p1-like isoform X1 [Drosophila nasuta]|uniref:cytochrome P450 4p1-like isoform X1 n=1 Tax=Drosophila nasuta TaxID=42062 RepID=UPI00295E9B42|nr:cytochrome P450 4p1-like isoform X1 [Drosophila nasuta]